MFHGSGTVAQTAS